MLSRAELHPFPATRRLTLVVVALLATHVVLACVALQAAFVFVELAWLTVADQEGYRALLASHLAQFRTLRAAQAVLWLAAAVAFVRWVGRAQANLPALGSIAFRYAPRQAMIAFLVPGPNLVRPLAVLRELWTASDPRDPAGMTRRAADTPARVRWWWGLLLAAAVGEATARGLALRPGLALDLGPAMQALILGQLLAAAAAVVGIAVVLGVDSRQDAAARRRAAGNPRR